MPSHLACRCSGPLPITERCLAADVDRIVVGGGPARTAAQPELLQAKMSGPCRGRATTYERITGKILTDGLKPSWLIFSKGFAHRATRLVKRMLDLLLSAVGLVIAGPPCCSRRSRSRLDSPGPVLYRQDRVGEGGRVFALQVPA